MHVTVAISHEWPRYELKMSHCKAASNLLYCKIVGLPKSQPFAETWTRDVRRDGRRHRKPVPEKRSSFWPNHRVP